MANWAMFTKNQKIALTNGEPVTIGSKVYALCMNCKRIIRVNKPITGDIHICTD